jgi:hypothetical protein
MVKQEMIKEQTAIAQCTLWLWKRWGGQNHLFARSAWYRERSNTQGWPMVGVWCGIVVLLCSVVGVEEAVGDTVAWVKVTERGLSPQVFISKYFPQYAQQGYSWQDLVRQDGQRIQDPRRDFLLHYSYTVKQRGVEAPEEKTLEPVLFLSNPAEAPLLQERYKEFYGVTYNHHNQAYERQRMALRMLYEQVIQSDNALQQKVKKAEAILAPLALTLSDVLLVLAKIESSYNHLAIGRYGEASAFQFAPAYAFEGGLKIYRWEKYLENCARYGEMRARQIHSQELQALVDRYRQQYSSDSLLQELAKEDERFHPQKVIHVLVTRLSSKIQWFQTERLPDTLSFFFIGYKGGIGYLKRLLDHLQSQSVSLTESYDLLSVGTRAYTDKAIIDLTLTQYQRAHSGRKL